MKIDRINKILLVVLGAIVVIVVLIFNNKESVFSKEVDNKKKVAPIITDMVEIDKMEFDSPIHNFSLPLEEEQKKLGDKIPYPKVVVCQRKVYFYNNSKKPKKVIELPIIANHLGSYAFLFPNGYVATSKVEEVEVGYRRRISFYKLNGEKYWKDIIYNCSDGGITKISDNGKYFAIDSSWGSVDVGDFEVYELGVKKLWSMRGYSYSIGGIFNDGKVVLLTGGIKTPNTRAITIFNTNGSVYNEFIDKNRSFTSKVFVIDDRSFLMCGMTNQGLMFKIYDIDKGVLWSVLEKYDVLGYLYKSLYKSSDGRYITVTKRNGDKRSKGLLDLRDRKEKWMYDKDFLKKNYGFEGIEAYGAQLNFLDDKYLIYSIQEYKDSSKMNLINNKKEREDYLKPRKTQIIIFNLDGNIILSKVIKVEEGDIMAKMSIDRKYLFLSSQGCDEHDKFYIRIFKLKWGDRR